MIMRHALRYCFCCPATAAFLAIASGVCADVPLDKRQYTLGNPVPRELLRPLSADRPDTTESPYTVDAGHVQIESSLIDWVREGGDETLTFASTNLKVGLRHDVDLQFVFDPYVRVRANDNDTREGFGDTQIRLKLNFFGNDGGASALGVMPFIKLPTASDAIGNDELEGGLIVPFALDLTEGVGLGLMAEFDAVYDEADDDHDLEFVHTAVLGFDLTERLGSFIEYVGVLSGDSSSPYVAAAGAGLTYALNDNCQLDCGVNFGLNGAADDLNPFIGITVRF